MDLDKGTLRWETPVYSKKVSLTKKIDIPGYYRRINLGFLTKFTLGFDPLDLWFPGGFRLFYPRFKGIIPEVYMQYP
jgi:hypothetical protein